MMGKIVSTLSLTKLQKYSLFQKYNARSATYKSHLAKFWCQKNWLTDLEMRACYGFGQLIEQRLLNLGKFGRVHHLKYILYLI